MENNSNIIIKGLLVILAFLTVSCDHNMDTLPINVIQLANSVGNYNVLNISEFTTEIKYIPLETNDSVLLSRVMQIICDNEKILIESSRSCWLFDNTGKFCHKIGHEGQGPNDYLVINKIFLNENEIFLEDRNKILIYDTNGNLVEKINWGSNEMPTEYSGYNYRNILPFKKNTYVMNFALYDSGNYPQAILFEKQESGLKIIKEYPNSVKLDKLREGYYFHELGVMYRYKDEMRVHKMINDTVFSIDQNAEMKDVFVFDFGKYRTTRAYYEKKEGVDDRYNYSKKFISVNTFCESVNHLFITFDFGNHAPEPIEFVNRQGNQSFNPTVHGVFDKRTGELTLMRQPIRGKLGLKNDIDNGPVIWPQYISSNKELVTNVSAEDFLEYYKNTSNPSPQMTEVAKNLKYDDNPIVIIAKLKE